MTTLRFKSVLQAFAASGLLAVACAASAQPATQPTSNASDASGPAAPIGAGAVRAIRDKQTGLLRRATAAEVAEMIESERLQRAALGQPDPATAPSARAIIHHPSGMVSAILGPEHLVTVKAVRGPDGRLVRAHTHPGYEHPSAQTTPAQQRPTE